MIVFLFLSCSTSKDLSFVFSEEESNSILESSTELFLIGEWEIGDEKTCLEPNVRPTWKDESALLWGENRIAGDGQPAGCLALIPDGE